MVPLGNSASTPPPLEELELVVAAAAEVVVAFTGVEVVVGAM